MGASGILRLEREGPAGVGLEPMELDPADFQSRLPGQHIHLYVDEPEIGLSAGVWTTTSMQEAFGPYPSDEFMFVLEGRVVMVDGDGGETPIEEGQTFVVRNAIPTSWKQEGFLRKFFLIYAPPDQPAPEIASAEGGVTVLDATALGGALRPLETTDPFLIDGAAPRQQYAAAFTNDAGNLHVGLWESTPFESRMAPFPAFMMVQVLEGTLAIAEETGKIHEFEAGDVFFVRRGAVCSWRAKTDLRTFRATLDLREPST